MVVEQKGLSEASFVLNTHLSTLSNSISKLEGRLGFVLCQRGNKGFKLTEKGASFYKASVKLVDGIEEYRDEVNKIINVSAGTLKIGVLAGTVSSDPFKLDRILGKFRDTSERVKIKLVYLSNLSLITDLLNNKLDFIFFSSLTNHSSIEATYLSDRTSYLYCHESHPLYGRSDDEITPEQISEYETVRLLYGSTADYEAINPGIVWNFTASCNSLAGCLSLMKTGQYIGMMPACEMDALPNPNTFKKISPSQFKSKPVFNAFGLQKNILLSPMQQKFCEVVNSFSV